MTKYPLVWTGDQLKKYRYTVIEICPDKIRTAGRYANRGLIKEITEGKSEGSLTTRSQITRFRFLFWPFTLFTAIFGHWFCTSSRKLFLSFAACCSARLDTPVWIPTIDSFETGTQIWFDTFISIFQLKCTGHTYFFEDNCYLTKVRW